MNQLRWNSLHFRSVSHANKSTVQLLMRWFARGIPADSTRIAKEICRKRADVLRLIHTLRDKGAIQLTENGEWKWIGTEGAR